MGVRVGFCFMGYDRVWGPRGHTKHRRLNKDDGPMSRYPGDGDGEDRGTVSTEGLSGLGLGLG